MKKIILFMCAVVFSLNQVLFAEEINENELFSSQESVVKKEDIQTPKKRLDAIVKETKFSGEITSVNTSILNRDKIAGQEDDNLYTYIIGNFFLDSRIKNNLKFFANTEVNHVSQIDTTTISLKEMFVDFSVKNKVYVRTGKQVLQWGRCYLWNPTDYINIDKKIFLTRIGYQEGTYGLKFHVPWGAKYNWYTFIDTQNADTVKQVPIATKFEFLIGRTEMALNYWVKDSFRSAYGYDFSTRIGKFDIVGEASTSYGDTKEKIKIENNVLEKYILEDKWVTKASLDISKYFDFHNVNDRITVRGEFFYNSNGYTENVFSDKNIYNYAEPVINEKNFVSASGTKKDYLVNSGIYEANYFSKYYAALFTSLDRFIIPDMVLSFNAIRNLSDDSMILVAGINYKDLSDFSLGLETRYYIGKDNMEYTFSNYRFLTQFTIGLAF
jgi:hypothetical protein